MTVDRRQALLHERAALLERVRQIDEELEEIHEQPVNSVQPPVHDAVKANLKDGSLRDFIIAIVSEVGFMVSNTTIRYLYEARFGKTLTASQLSDLSEAELPLRNSKDTTVYGLTHPFQLKDNELHRVSSLWVRSDWPVYQRIYLPTTMKLVNLHFLDWYITLHGSRHHQYLSNPTITNHIRELVSNLGLEKNIQEPYDSIRAKKTTIHQIEQVRREEETIYSGDAFKIVSIHQRAKKNLETTMSAETNLKV